MLKFLVIFQLLSIKYFLLGQITWKFNKDSSLFVHLPIIKYWKYIFIITVKI